MAQLGHTDAAFTPRVYAHAMRRDVGDKERLRRSSRAAIGHHWALTGHRSHKEAFPRRHPRTTKTPRVQGLQTMGAAGFEPATSRV